MDLSKGGYKIIDITSLPLSEVTEADDITDVKILKQLLSLSEYALHPDRKLKPIYLRSIDKDGVENVAMAELDRNNGSMRILALINLMMLQIFVSYSVDADTQEVSIDTASYVCIKDETRIINVVQEAIDNEDIEVEHLKFLLDEDITLSNLPTGLVSYYAHARISNDKLSIVLAFGVPSGDSVSAIGETEIGRINVSNDILSKLYPYITNVLDTRVGQIVIVDSPYEVTAKTLARIRKGDTYLSINLIQEAITAISSTGIIRFEFNFLLS